MACTATINPGKPAPRNRDPAVWLVLSDKKGDNGQVHAIQDALGWQCQRKYVRMREAFVLGKPGFGPTLDHVDLERSDPLEPPWPDLIITAGRRPANVALWIRMQSGGHTRIALVGKPSGRVDSFDIVIVSAENLLPPLGNVMRISFPLMRVDTNEVRGAAALWETRFSELPRPLTGLMIGGPTGPYKFGKATVRTLLEIGDTIIAKGGTPYFTTSRRTPAGVATELERNLPEKARLFKWDANAADNPYLGLLALADGFVVTGDSISMMVEITRLGKPLSILPLRSSPVGMIDQIRRSGVRWLFKPCGETQGDRFRITLARVLYRAGLVKQTRDFDAFHRILLEHGLANPPDKMLAPPVGAPVDEAARVAQRLKLLLTPSSVSATLPDTGVSAG